MSKRTRTLTLLSPKQILFNSTVFHTPSAHTTKLNSTTVHNINMQQTIQSKKHKDSPHSGLINEAFCSGQLWLWIRLLLKRALLHLSALCLRPKGSEVRWTLSGCVMSCPIEVAVHIMTLSFSSVRLGVGKPMVLVAVFLRV